MREKITPVFPRPVTSAARVRVERWRDSAMLRMLPPNIED